MYFPDDKRNEPMMEEAMTELSLASFNGFKSKHDDFIDTVSMLAVMPAWKPSEGVAMKKSTKDSGMWDMDLDDDNEDAFQSYLV